jgi:hypothetical protein
VAVSEKFASALFGSGLGLGLSHLVLYYDCNQPAFFGFFSLSIISAFGIHRHFLLIEERRVNLEKAMKRAGFSDDKY